MTATLKKHYNDVVFGEMKKDFGIANVHDVPKIEKIVINSAIGSDADKNFIQDLLKEISAIAGQKGVIIKAKKSISNFKLRAGMPNGVKVTLRGEQMYEFLLRLVAIAFPKIRDFRGISNKMDGHGNYSIGIADHTIFPEINVDRERKSVGMDITIVTTAKTDKMGHDLLAKMGLPFRKGKN